MITNKSIKISHRNRGLYFEEILNKTNKYYLEKKICVVHKKATPIKILKTTKNKIVSAVYKEKSTTDYNGVYKGLYIDFEAKQTTSDKFYIRNIHQHQIKHLLDVEASKGIGFILVYFVKFDQCFYLEVSDIVNKKSISYEEFVLKYECVRLDLYVHYIDIVKRRVDEN